MDLWTPGDTAADSHVSVLSCNILIKDTVYLLLETPSEIVGKDTAYGWMLYTHTSALLSKQVRDK